MYWTMFPQKAGGMSRIVGLVVGAGVVSLAGPSSPFVPSSLAAVVAGSVGSEALPRICNRVRSNIHVSVKDKSYIPLVQ